MVSRECTHCGLPFVGQRATAKYCSTRCRVAATRARQRDDHDESASTAAEQSKEPRKRTHALVLATRRTLRAAGVLNTVEGQRAVLLAERAANPRESGSAVATLATRLQEAVDGALASVGRTDQMDEVNKRRDAKLKQARGA